MDWLFRSKFLMLLALGLVIWGVERLIVTDKEAIENLAEALAEDVRHERWDAMQGRLHPQFEYGKMDGAQTIEHIQDLVKRFQPGNVGLNLFDIEVDGDTAKSKGHVWANAAGRPGRLAIDARFVKTDDGWVLREVLGGYFGR